MGAQGSAISIGQGIRGFDQHVDNRRVGGARARHYDMKVSLRPGGSKVVGTFYWTNDVVAPLHDGRRDMADAFDVSQQLIGLQKNRMAKIMRLGPRHAYRYLWVLEVARLVGVMQQGGAAALPIAPGLGRRQAPRLVGAIESTPVRFDHGIALFHRNVLKVVCPAFGKDPRGATIEFVEPA